MKIIFISNYFTHHQKPLSDALYKITNGNYIFIATEKMSDDRIKQGWTIKLPDYVRELDMSNKTVVLSSIVDINNADAVIQGHLYDCLIEERVKAGKLTFIYNERLYKSIKRYLKAPLYLYKGIKYSGCYVLAASAFTPYDYSITRSYKNRCFKFGYFPVTKYYNNIDELIKNKKKTQILWVARLIDWKHPEVAVQVAKRLKMEGYQFNLKMVGTGPLMDHLVSEVERLGLENFVSLIGVMKPEDVRTEMEQSGIFIFTSDKNEGWGAVLNEAMNSGCACVASHSIGATPYLLTDGMNGYIYDNDDFESLYHRVKSLLDNPTLQSQFGANAYNTITQVWNAQVAASNLCHLINSLTQGDGGISHGPCSYAPIIKNNWFKCQ